MTEETVVEELGGAEESSSAVPPNGQASVEMTSSTHRNSTLLKPSGVQGPSFSPAQVAPNKPKPASITKVFQERSLYAGDSRATFEAKKANARVRDMQKSGFVIDPRQSKFMSKWDLTMVAMLLFTAVWTPVEVAFLDEGAFITPMFCVNRVVDLCFSIDIVLTFFLAYQESSKNGGHWVFNSVSIARHYLKGWFLPDFISVFPFWIIILDRSDIFGQQAAYEQGIRAELVLNGTISPSELNEQTNSLTRTTVLLRIVKLLRMIKLARVFKASRILQRALLDYVMNEWEWTFAVLKMVKLLIILTAYAHWQACIWGLISSYMQAEGVPNWIGDFVDAHNATYGSEFTPAKPTGLEIYVAALYWSVMTLTSIGYGEMTPVNTPERILCSVWMMCSGFVWAYVIGTFAAIASTLDPNAIAYQTTMDNLNYFMRERELTREMRLTLRDYFQNARRVHQTTDDGDLLEKMSPLLQGTVALAANRKWCATPHTPCVYACGRTRGPLTPLASLARSISPLLSLSPSLSRHSRALRSLTASRWLAHAAGSITSGSSKTWTSSKAVQISSRRSPKRSSFVPMSTTSGCRSVNCTSFVAGS